MSEEQTSERARFKTLRFALIGAGAVAAALAIGAGGYWLGASRAPAASQTEDGRRVLYWYDPMVPDQHFDAPGKSPFMDMDLVPRYADEEDAPAGVRIDPVVAQNLGVRLATVERAPIAQTVTAAGVLAFNDRNVAILQARAAGFVERAYGRAVGDVLAPGAPIVDIRVPEWTAAQAEYLALRSAGPDIAEAARRRLAMLGMPPSLIERVEREGAPHPLYTLTAPIAGALTALDVRSGMTVAEGAPLASINALSPIWLIVSLPQADAGVARPDGRVIARTPAFPGEEFEGRIESVLPAADLATRTVGVRIALANRDGRLRPGLTADVRIAEPDERMGLLAPSEAVIRTGRRTVAILAPDAGRYVPVEIVVGRQIGDRVEVREGLEEGQRVVASGQFLIDSEASLSGALERMQSAPPVASSHETRGRVTAIDGVNVTIAHEPIAALSWPAMTMGFVLERAELGRGLAVGDSVTLRFRQEGGRFVIQEIAKERAP